MDKIAAKAEAEGFLKSLLNRNLRVYTTDGRLFVGTFKCTDTHSNIVLSLTYEYRQPSQQKLAELAEAVAASAESGKGTVAADMPSRYLGLVVIPGPHIVKMEVEEFASQVKSRSIFERRDLYGSTAR
ncbi:Sm-like ribonucleoprotein [Hypoxylon rubiginosum]|uniref:Sm-like ribonucleoprotein n=1 Tax=Hypoxylon rubiginosum TaxID=110542 RepID=A0ACB9Z1B7_9PEZI|nr:Sm-like ribonucleoprotein [Hypoxylon rubiginosum]